MFCKKCGAPLVEGANFCDKCGTSVSETSSQEAVKINYNAITSNYQTI